MMESTVHHSLDRNVYLVISDLHETYKKKENRVNYTEEMQMIRKKILQTVREYHEKGYRVYILFLGDIFDLGYREIFKAIETNNFYILLRESCEAMYSVVGNHELTYYNNNPFYTLVTEIRSNKLQQIKNKIWKPRGVLPIIDVIDKIEDGEVAIHFNHYGTTISSPDSDKINIGLYHQSIVCQEILDEMKAQLKEEVFGATPIDFSSTGIFNKFAYNFFGHMHKVYGDYVYTDDDTGWESHLVYLASLGRPNYTEVSDNFLQRNIPAILVENGKFVGVEDNKFQLMSYSECVNDIIVKANKEVSQKRAEIKKVIKEYNPDLNKPIQNLLDSCAEDVMQQNIIKDLLEHPNTRYEIELARDYNKVVGGTK